MADRMTPLQRRTNMAAIRGKDTKPEIVVRKWLWSHGFRYRLNHPRLPGRPDIVLRKYSTCIFINGCFWHGHNLSLSGVNSEELNANDDSINNVMTSIQDSGCCKIPKSNTGFWVRKIVRNHERDIEVQQKLAAMGWHCVTIWECELKPSNREHTLQSLAYTLNRIFLQDHSTHTYHIPEEESSMAAEEEL